MSKKRNGQTEQAAFRGLSEEIYEKRGFPLSWLFSFFKPHIPAVAAALLIAGLSSLLGLAGPYIIAVVIDDYLMPGNGSYRSLIFLGLLYLGSTLLSSVLGYIQSNMAVGIGQRIVHRIRTGLFDKIQRLNMSFFDKNSAGRILTRLTSDIDALSEMFSNLMVSLFVDAITIVGIIAALFMQSPKVGAASMPVLPLIAASIVAYKILIKKNFIRLKAALSRLNGYLAESINGMGIIKLFGREKEKNARFAELSGTYYRLGLREVIMNTFSHPFIGMLNNLATVFLFWIFAPDVFGGALEIGVLYAAITYLKRFFEPVLDLVEQFTNIQSAFVSAERIYNIMQLDGEEDYESGDYIKEPLRGEIEFQNVWFAYNGDNYVIKDLSFKIKAGESVAFVGSTGSGKSTVISLLARFYKINSGKILLDGKDIYSYNLPDLRRRIAIIQQEPFLFTGNIRYNITMGSVDYHESDIEQAAKTASADTFILELPDKYSNAVSERGKTFSAGQRQLISFARAAVTSPSIFILDEATANIDTATEESIKTALERASRGVTTITIAHRLSTVKGANRIYVLSLGRLIEAGTHEELMKLEGVYAKLYLRSVKEV